MFPLGWSGVVILVWVYTWQSLHLPLTASVEAVKERPILQDVVLMLLNFLVFSYYSSRKHAYIILTPLNPTFI